MDAKGHQAIYKCQIGKKLVDLFLFGQCDHCDTIFVATRKMQRYCCDKCRRKGE